MVNFRIKGPGEIAGVGNGNPQSHEPFVASYRKLFNGKAMLILKSIKGGNGNIEVSASSGKLKEDKVYIISR